jgi:serine/threonine protein kinase
VCSGLRHLHSLGIVHRDLRAANVLVVSTAPLRVVLADFGLSHLLSAVASRPVAGAGMWGVDLRASVLGSSTLVGEVTGAAALGPALWTAPETCVASASGGTPVTFACDVYMLGGLLYELLTAGVPPFDWLLENPDLFVRRRTSRVPVRVPGLPGVMASGLFGKSVLEVAAGDGVEVPWCVAGAGTAGGGARLAEAKALLASCWSADPKGRPSVGTLERDFLSLCDREVRCREHPWALLVRWGIAPPPLRLFPHNCDLCGLVALCVGMLHSPCCHPSSPLTLVRPVCLLVCASHYPVLPSTCTCGVISDAIVLLLRGTSHHCSPIPGPPRSTCPSPAVPGVQGAEGGRAHGWGGCVDYCCNMYTRNCAIGR